jgi:peptidoglycan/xylan/chitin deacetylase (PgdA/CDA1 family)
MNIPAKTPALVRLLGQGLIFSVHTTEKIAYLTFDDGPIPELTPWILDQLAVYQAKATFFMVGENVLRYPEIARRVLDEGHRIGNHTHRHLNGFKTRVSDYIQDTENCASALAPYLTPEDELIFRPPYGKISPREAFLLKKMGYQIVLWDVLSKDYETELPSPEVYRNVVENLSPGSIIVMHDNKKATRNVTESLPEILKTTKEMGYRLEPLPSRIN